jgi:hypothetical protein
MCLLWSTNWVFISQKTTFFVVSAVKASDLTSAISIPCKWPLVNKQRLNVLYNVIMFICSGDFWSAREQSSEIVQYIQIKINDRFSSCKGQLSGRREMSLQSDAAFTARAVSPLVLSVACSSPRLAAVQGKLTQHVSSLDIPVVTSVAAVNNKECLWRTPCGSWNNWRFGETSPPSSGCKESAS